NESLDSKRLPSAPQGDGSGDGTGARASVPPGAGAAPEAGPRRKPTSEAVTDPQRKAVEANALTGLGAQRNPVARELRHQSGEQDHAGDARDSSAHDRDGRRKRARDETCFQVAQSRTAGD